MADVFAFSLLEQLVIFEVLDAAAPCMEVPSVRGLFSFFFAPECQ